MKENFKSLQILQNKVLKNIYRLPNLHQTLSLYRALQSMAYTKNGKSQYQQDLRSESSYTPT